MPRKGPAIKREPKPDPVYHNPLATQFINRLMLRGKRSLAEKIVYGALKIISEKTGGDPTQTLRKATDSVRRRCHVPGPHGGPLPALDDAGDPLDRQLLTGAAGAHHGGPAGRRVDGCSKWCRCFREAAGGPA